MGDPRILFLNSIFSTITLCSLLLINMVNFYLLENMLKAQQLSSRNSQLEKQLAMQQQHFDTLTTAYRNTRKLVHDTKNHAIYLRSGIGQGRDDELIDAIDRFVGDLESSYIISNTGNLAIDALVGSFANRAEEKSISFSHSLSIGRDKLNIADYDMCIILGNLLENAYNACCKLPDNSKAYMQLTITTDDNKLIIHVVNSCAKQSGEDEINHIGYSMEHGFGLQNINNTVLKLSGQFTYGYAEPEIFTADVVIPLPLE